MTDRDKAFLDMIKEREKKEEQPKIPLADNPRNEPAGYGRNKSPWLPADNTG